ncbi:hypothetical protein AVEN_139518-1 [Araneus ventricosus]|uniref:Uncharacterized protein n=1 Tax=Araneus ventricosus TaxID=182803 RepID=A0A4Y2UD38_ARAVE|nr:hypothetical protein AVEN_139518-1 [Araneus ventricosus]
MTRTIPELASPSPNFRTLAVRRLLASTYHLACPRPRCSIGKVSALGPEGSRFETRFHSRVCGLLHVKSHVETKRPPVGVTWEFGEGMPGQMSSSSSDRG